MFSKRLVLKKKKSRCQDAGTALSVAPLLQLLVLKKRNVLLQIFQHRPAATSAVLI